MNDSTHKYLYGITAAMVTLFNNDQSIDLDATRTLTDFLISKRINCLYPLGTTGEMYRLLKTERMSVAEAVIEQAAGRVPVYIHVGAMVQSEVIELAHHAVKAGADGIGAVSPTYYPATSREIIAFYSTLVTSVPKDYPVYLYNIPQLTANDLTAAIVNELADKWPNIVGIKYSWPDFRRAAEYIRVRDGNFSVMLGSDALLPAVMALGCDGTVSGVSCAYPEPFVAMYEAIRRNDWNTARFHQRFADDYANELRNGGDMAYFKAALCYRGVLKEYQMRAPQMTLTVKQTKDLYKNLEALDSRYAEEKKRLGIT